MVIQCNHKLWLEVEHWGSVRENVIASTSVAVQEALSVLTKVGACEATVDVKNFKIATVGIHMFRNTVKVLKPVQDFIAECAQVELHEVLIFSDQT